MNINSGLSGSSSNQSDFLTEAQPPRKALVVIPPMTEIPEWEEESVSLASVSSSSFSSASFASASSTSLSSSSSSSLKNHRFSFLSPSQFSSKFPPSSTSGHGDLRNSFSQQEEISSIQEDDAPDQEQTHRRRSSSLLLEIEEKDISLHEGFCSPLQFRRRSSISITGTMIKAVRKMLGHERKDWVNKAYETMEQAKTDTEFAPISTKAGGGVGCSGSYFIHHYIWKKDPENLKRFLREKQNIAIFKPRDQEPGMAHGSKSQLLSRLGIAAGDSVVREWMASCLLPDYGPSTILAELESNVFRVEGENSSQTKWIGSLQEFIPNDGDMKKLSVEDHKRIHGVFPEKWKGEIINPSNLNIEMPIDSLHCLMLGDLFFGNTDRNLGNFLVQRKSSGQITHLKPIDHGCIACIGFDDQVKLCWMDWPTSHMLMSKNVKKWMIDHLNAYPERILRIERNCPALCENEDKQEMLNTLVVWHAILRHGLHEDLTPYQMGSFFMFKEISRSIAELVYEQAPTVDKDKSFEENVKFLVKQLVEMIKISYKKLVDGQIESFTQKEIHSILYKFMTRSSLTQTT